jgi:hypothetical protein
VFGSLLDGRNRAATPTVGRRSMSLLAESDIGSRLSDPPRTISISVFPAACQPIVGACIIAFVSDDMVQLKMKWVAAAILAGAGIWAGATLDFYTTGTEWRWIGAAIAVEAIILASAIALPVGRETRSKMVLGTAAAVFVTTVAVAVLLPRRWCFGYNWSGGPPYDCSELTVWGRILVVGVGLAMGLILASFARQKPDARTSDRRVHRRP